MAPSTDFLTALHAEAATLSEQFPHLAARLAKATSAIEQGRVFPEDDGHTAMVQSKQDAALWYHVNGACPCKAAQHRNEVCYHRLAARVYHKVCDRLEADKERWTIDLDNPALTPAPPTIPAEGILTIQGKPFVKFEALLHLAHERGLIELTTTVVSVSEALAVCQCVARFADGRTFCDIGDASEANVTPQIRKHFIRMASTRAAARALRRALDISTCALEELGGDEVGA